MLRLAIHNAGPRTLANVFLSYATDDSAFAKRLGKALIDEGIDVWLDKDSLQPGDDWINVISTAIQKAEIFIPIISKSYVKSNYIDSEIAAAIAAKSSDPTRKIIPVLIDKNARSPSFIDQYHYLDLSNNHDFSEGVLKLKDAILSEKVHGAKNDLVTSGILVGRDIQLTKLEHDQRKFDQKQKGRNIYIGYISFVSFAATMLGLLAASTLIFFDPEKGLGFVSISITLLAASTGLIGSILGYYFGRSSKEGKESPQNEIPK